MSRGEPARVRGAGREGPRATRPVSGLPHHGALVSGSAGEVMASETCTRVWEAAYRQYAARGNGVLGAAKVTPEDKDTVLTA